MKSLTIDDVLLPKQLIDKLRKENWAPLTIPNSTYTPGAIIMVTTDEIRWVGHLRDCFPREILETISGLSPSIKVEGNKDFSLEALLQIFGVGFTGSLTNVRKVVLDVTEYGIDSLDMLKLEIWDKDHYEQMSRGCVDKFNNVATYVVQEAFVVRKGTYSLSDEKGTTIKLNQVNIGDVQFGGGVTIKATNDGKLEVNSPIVFAVKKVARVGYGIHFDWIPIKAKRKEPETGAADEQIKEIFFKKAPMK